MTYLLRKVISLFSTPKSDVAGDTEPSEKCPDSNPHNSQSDNCVVENPEHKKRLADAVREKSTLLPQTGPLPVYTIPLTEDQINVPGCKRFSFGIESISNPKPNRTIMVLGATGAGKSTLINGMINYILGVEWEDTFRFKLVDEDQSKSQAHSQTSEVTAYRINHQEGFKIEHSLTIVDTPGFGDTRGIEGDRMITEQIRNLFSSKSGVSEIDAICFVAQASLVRLTPTQKYVFDSVLSIFGKDVAENIRVLVTFADGQLPPVLEAINESGVPCPTKDGLPVHFKFNNSALFADNKSSAANSSNEDDEDGGFDQMFWNMGTKSMKRFFLALNVIETKSLTMTKEVLGERKQLENSVENLQKQVKVGLAKLDEIKETSDKLKEHEAEISRNENFEFEVTITKAFQIDNSGKGFLTNCQICDFTCHKRCIYGDDKDKHQCCAMGRDGNCKQCPGKCHWSSHFNQKYCWEYKEVKEKRTAKELQEKFNKASKAKLSVRDIIEKLKAEYDAVQAEVVKFMQRSAKCLNRLKDIALRPNPLSTPEYIDMLIEGEKSEGKPGWKKRVEALTNMRQKAEFMGKVEKGETFLQGPLTDSQHSNKGQTNANQDEVDTIANQNKAETDTNQDEAETDTNQDKAETNTNQDEAETKTNQDKAKTDTDQDEAESNTNQDKTETDTNQDKAETDTNQDEAETNTNQDKAGTDTNQDKAETDTNQDKAETDTNQDEAETNTNQDKVGTDTNQDKAEADTNQDEAETNTNQDKVGTDTNQDEAETNTNQDKVGTDTNQDEAEGDTNQEKAETDTNQDEAETNTNQDKVGTDTAQDEAETDTDQDKAENNTNQDEAETDTDQDKADTDTDQDEAVSKVDQDKAETDTDQDEAETDTDQDEAETDTDQDKVGTDNNQDEDESNLDQDKAETNTNQDKTETSTNQDEAETDANQDEAETNTDQDKSGPYFEIDSNMNEDKDLGKLG